MTCVGGVICGATEHTHKAGKHQHKSCSLSPENMSLETIIDEVAVLFWLENH